KTGLYYYGARYYDPETGRFMQADSVIPGVTPQAYNRYTYTLNNPTRYVDPTGHQNAEPLTEDERGIEEARQARGYLAANVSTGLIQLAPVVEAAVSMNPFIAAHEAVTGDAAVPGQPRLSWWQRALQFPGATKVLGFVAGKAAAVVMGR